MISTLSEKTMRYYFCTFLPPDLDIHIRSINKRYDNSSRLAPHNITLLPPHTLRPESTEDSFLADLATGAKGLRQFTIQYGGIGRFNFDGLHVVYLSVRRDMALLSCNEALQTAAKAHLLPEDVRYIHLPTPHITLAKVRDHEVAESICADLSSIELSGSFISSQICLLRRECDENGWEILKELELK